MKLKHWKTGQVKDVPTHAIGYHMRLKQKDGTPTWEEVKDAIEGDGISNGTKKPRKKKERADRLPEATDANVQSSHPGG